MASPSLTSVDATHEAITTIGVMRMQEETTYHSSDYLDLYHQQQVERPSKNGPLPTNPADVECRSKMVQWSYEIVDFCQLHRETVSISMSYLDRYLMTEPGRLVLRSRKVYQLTAMTCLYTAIKLHEPQAIDPASVSKLSRGVYTEREVTDMEMSILDALKWRVNPPTTMAFVRQFLSLLPAFPQYEAAMEIARFQSELAVYQYDFVKVNHSTIAFACVTNALERVNFDSNRRRDFLDFVAKTASINRHAYQLRGVQAALRSIGAVGKFGSLLPAPPSSEKAVQGCGSVNSSPRSVSNCTNQA